MSNTAKETLQKAQELLDSRGKIYGPPELNFERIARIAEVILARPVTRYEVAVFLFATKIGRIPEDPCYSDSYDDAINYAAFMKQFREEVG
jgi:hypothetical protein